MEGLRKPFFIVALVLAVLIVMIELGKASFDAVVKPPGIADICTKLPPEFQADCNSIPPAKFASLSAQQPPGIGIPYLAFIDASVLFTLALMGIALVVPQRVVGRTQGCATLIYSLLLILGGIAMILLVALVKLILMVSLFLAIPFGTLTYLAIYGFFARGAANGVLGVLLLLKLGLGGSLILAHQRFLQNRGLVLLIITSLVGGVIVSFLHGLVPIILVSITDAIGAICGGILGVIWGILLLIGSIISIVKVIRVN